MSNLSYTKEFFLLAVNGKGGIPLLKETGIYACLLAGGLIELIGAGMVSKDEKGRLVVTKEFDETFMYLFPLYERIASAKKSPKATALLFESKQLKELITAVRDTLIAKDFKDELTNQGLFKNKTKYISKPEVVREIIEKINGQFFGDEPLDKKTVCLVAMLEASGLTRDYFGKIDAKLLKEQLKELENSDAGILANELIEHTTAMFATLAAVTVAVT